MARVGNWGLLAKNLRDTSRAGTFPDADLDYYRYAWDRDGAMGAMINWYRASFRLSARAGRRRPGARPDTHRLGHA